MLSRYRLTLAFLISFIFGLIFFFFLGEEIFLRLLTLLAFSIILLGVVALLLSSKYLQSLFWVLALIYSSFFLSALRMESFHSSEFLHTVSHYQNQYVDLEGQIVEEVDKRDSFYQYVVELSEISGLKTSGRILIKTASYPEYKYGDILSLQGKIKIPKDSDDFAYKNYLSRYEIYGIMSYPKIDHLGYEPPSEILAWLFTQKLKFLDRINQIYPEPQASFLSGLLIGARKGMNEEITKEFQITGLAHIVAVSGSNITMLLALILTIFIFLPRFLAFALSLITIIAFTIFVGMSSAVIRAAIMGVIGLVAVHTGRSKAPLMALLLTVFIMCFYQPKILFYDVGFQLSVSAIIGVIWLVPLLPNFFKKLPEHFGVREAVALTISAQITTLPVSVFHFHAFSLIAPIANLFVVPLIPFAMLFGFLSLLPLPFLSELFAYISFLILKACLFFTHIFASIPYAQISDIWVNSWWWVLYVFLLGFVFWWRRNNSDIFTNIA
ncbi:DUF4131 domain-containing protein [Candidatus Peregrinibacteria bacterium]|jgi:competence protein ComEC|nr:DUF4131 domain-containing protein [Candidatus Peregrinibacteria bacterium]